MYPAPCQVGTHSPPASAHRYGYVSVLATDSYLDGVLVLYHSLRATGTAYPFLLLVGDLVSEASLAVLSRHGIRFKSMRRTIDNPTAVAHNNHWAFTYSKLDIFRQIQFDKIVFLDADMLILENIDELFAKPHMAAVNAGGMLPECSNWTGLNSGLMVVEPCLALYRDMLSKVGRIEVVEEGGDQDFLQAYFPTWHEDDNLHLDHGYNMFHCHLDRYRAFGYQIGEGKRRVRVIHYIGGEKPWSMAGRKFIRPVQRMKRYLRKLVGAVKPVPFPDELLVDSLAMWHRMFQRVESGP